MINNWPAAVAAAAAVATAACRKPDITDGRYQGMVEYDQRDLAFENPGRLIELDVHRGQLLASGTVIGKQDDSLDRQGRTVDARALEVAKAERDLVNAGSRPEDIRAAEAQLVAFKAAEKNAQIELARERGLVDKGALPAAGLDALEAQLASAVGARQAGEQRVIALRKGARAEEIERANARVLQASEALALDDRRLDKRTLSAPADGVVRDVFVQAGEMAGAGVPVVSVIDTKRPYADVFVPVPDAPRVRVGDRAQLRVEGLDGEHAGVVELVYPEAEFTPKLVYSPRERPSLMVRVRVRIEPAQDHLHAGLPAYVTFGDRGGT